MILNLLFYIFVITFLISISYFVKGTKEARNFDLKNKKNIKENDKKGLLFLGISILIYLMMFVLDKIFSL